MLRCLNRNKQLLYKYDYYSILHFIPNLLNYDTKYNRQNCTGSDRTRELANRERQKKMRRKRGPHIRITITHITQAYINRSMPPPQ